MNVNTTNCTDVFVIETTEGETYTIAAYRAPVTRRSKSDGTATLNKNFYVINERMLFLASGEKIGGPIHARKLRATSTYAEIRLNINLSFSGCLVQLWTITADED